MRALLVIDVQNDPLTDAFDRERVIANVGDLVAHARRTGLPVVWIQHNDPYMPIGSAPWQLVTGFAPAAGEPRLDKAAPSAFEATELAAVLDRIGARELVICGAQTDCCVHATVDDALGRGYRVVLVSDAHTTTDGAKVAAENQARTETCTLATAVELTGA